MARCISCKNKRLIKIISIGRQPLSGTFLKNKKLKLKKYSLDLSKCNKCGLVQLKNMINKKKLFGDNYVYRTTLSKLMINRLNKKYKEIIKERFINNDSKVLDIGSIDRTTSKNKVLKNTKNKKIKFDLITSFAMFYSIKDPRSFCADIHELLSSRGIWVLEILYLPLILKNLSYDQICHKHLAYYTITVFKNLIKKNNLKIIDIFFNEVNGGSAEIICARQDSILKAKENKINLILNDEKKINFQSFKNFEKRIDNNKKIIKLFLNLNSQKKVLGYGASTKGNFILNQCNINNQQISFICDKNNRKKNKFTPGSNIKIISKELMRKKKPDYLFVLIWSYRKEVIKQEIRYLQSGGCLVFPLPKFHLVNKFNYKEYLKKDFKIFSYHY